MTESFNLSGLALYDCAVGGCEVTAVLAGALLVALVALVVCARFLR